MTDQDYIKGYNSLIRFVNNNIERVLGREGELPSSYFKDGVLDRLNVITENVKTVEDIKERFDEIKNVHSDLKDGWKGLKASGKY